MKISYLPLILLMGISGSLGALFFKKGSGIVKNLRTFFFNPYIYLGAFFYLLSSVIAIILLKHLSYIMVVSFGTLVYLWSFILSLILLKERVSIYKIAGIFLIIIGVIFAALNYS